MASSRIEQRNRRTQSAKYKGVNDEIANISPVSDSFYDARNNKRVIGGGRSGDNQITYGRPPVQTQPTYNPAPAKDLSQYLVNAPQQGQPQIQPQAQDGNTFYSAPDKQRILIEQQLARAQSEKDRARSPAMGDSQLQGMLYDIEQKNKASWSAATAGKSPEEIQDMTNNYYRQKIDQSQDKRFNRFMSSSSNSYQPRTGTQPQFSTPQQQIRQPTTGQMILNKQINQLQTAGQRRRSAEESQKASNARREAYKQRQVQKKTIEEKYGKRKPDYNRSIRSIGLGV